MGGGRGLGIGDAVFWERFVMTWGRVRMLGVRMCFVCVGFSLWFVWVFVVGVFLCCSWVMVSLLSSVFLFFWFLDLLQSVAVCCSTCCSLLQTVAVCYVCVTWLICTYDVTRLYVTFIFVWPTNVPHYVCVTHTFMTHFLWLIIYFDITVTGLLPPGEIRRVAVLMPSVVWHRLIHVCSMCLIICVWLIIFGYYLRLDSPMSEPWHAWHDHDDRHTCDMTMTGILQLGTVSRRRCASGTRCVAGQLPLRQIITKNDNYGVATISRLLKIIGLFCKRAL